MLVVATRPPTARSRAEQQLFKNITKHRSALLCCEVDTLSLEQTRKSNFSSSLRLQLYGRRLTTTIGLLFSAVVVVVGSKTKITQNCILFLLWHCVFENDDDDPTFYYIVLLWLWLHNERDKRWQQQSPTAPPVAAAFTSVERER